MRIPNNKSRAYKVAMYLHRSGGATKAECIAEFHDWRTTHVREAINYMASENMLSERDGVFKVKPYLATHFDQCEPVEGAVSALVPPRSAPESRPLSAKFMLPKEPPRDDAQPLRDWSYKVGSVGFPVGYRL